MRDAESTIEKILDRSGELFNTQGYKATSLSEITARTGLTKGAIYRHFESKEELEKKTLSHLSSKMYEKMKAVIKSEPTAGRKLRAMFSFFDSYITNPPIAGGCPLLNVAIESDDAHPELRQGAVRILDTLRDSIIHILDNGIKHDQIREDIDRNYYATLIIASLEGAIMMSKLRGNNDDIRHVIRHLDSLVTKIER